MARDTDKYRVELEKLVAEMGALVAAHWGDRGLETHPNTQRSTQLWTRLGNLLEKACGTASAHAGMLRGIEGKGALANVAAYLDEALGVAEAALADLDAGLLSDARRLIQADILTDLVDQAQALLAAKYHPVAVVALAGGALEDGMRRMCDAKEIEYPSKTKLSKLTELLGKAGVFDARTVKRLGVLGDVRNSADHGWLDKVSADDAEDFVRQTRKILLDYLP